MSSSKSQVVARLFVAEHAGPLSIVDKKTRQAVTYINFNGSADAPGLFPKFAPTGGFVSGLMGFAFDPDYRRNGVFYTLHLENPALTRRREAEGWRAARSRRVAVRCHEANWHARKWSTPHA